MDNLYIMAYKSPLGPMTLTASYEGIRSIQFEASTQPDNPSNHLHYCKDQLDQYFAGTRKEFDLNLDLSGNTDFHRDVWEMLLKIPYGATCSYLDIAKKLDNVGAIRAVGRANGQNPIAIVIPCHRVIGSDGSLTGYASGLEKKQRLLALENPQCFALQGSLF